jgi:hypothetical protein
VKKPGYLTIEDNLSKKVSKTLSQLNKSDIVVPAYIPRNLEGERRNIMVQAQTRQRERTNLKIK